MMLSFRYRKVNQTTPHHQIVVISQIPTLETAVKLNGRITVLALVLAQPFTEFLKGETFGFEFQILTPIRLPTNGSVI